MSNPTEGTSDSTSTGMTTDKAYEISGMEKIEVDISSLSDFATAMQREYRNLQHAWDKIIPPLANGPQFGFDPTLDLGEKRAAYDAYLKQAQLLLRNVIEGTNQLSYAAERIAANYSRADQFAKLRAADVNKVLP